MAKHMGIDWADNNGSYSALSVTDEPMRFIDWLGSWDECWVSYHPSPLFGMLELFVKVTDPIGEFWEVAGGPAENFADTHWVSLFLTELTGKIESKWRYAITLKGD